VLGLSFTIVTLFYGDDFSCYANSAVIAPPLAESDEATTFTPKQEDEDRQQNNNQQLKHQCAWTGTSSSTNSNESESSSFQEYSCQAETVSDAWSEENVQQTAIYWELTEEQAADLRQLGHRLRDVDYWKNTPHEVVRFLLHACCNYDIDAAETMFRDSVNWRLENKVDSILQDYRPPQEMLDHYPGAIMKGVDKDGDPIFVARNGSTDGPGLLKRFGREEMLRHGIWEREMVWNGDWKREWERESGRPLKRLLIIDDVEGLQLVRTILNRGLMEVFRETVHMDKYNYPQSVKKFMVVRVPKIFETVWSVLKRGMDQLAVERLVITNPKHYVQELEKVVDLELLPEIIVPGIGKGEARPGFPDNFDTRPVPQL